MHKARGRGEGEQVEEREKEIWESQPLNEFPNLFFFLFRRDRYFPFKLVKVTRDSNWLARYDAGYS